MGSECNGMKEGVKEALRWDEDIKYTLDQPLVIAQDTVMPDYVNT